MFLAMVNDKTILLEEEMVKLRNGTGSSDYMLTLCREIRSCIESSALSENTLDFMRDLFSDVEATVLELIQLSQLKSERRITNENETMVNLQHEDGANTSID